VADESVKARINLYRDPAQNTTLAQKRALLAGHRPDPSVIKGPDGSLLSCLPTDLIAADFATATANAGKIISLGQAELLDNAKDKIKPLRNDITPYSLGVLADVRGGGLKQDLSSMFEMGSATSNTLPADFASKKLYQSTHGITGVSDPNWSALAGYYNSFLSVTSPETKPTYATKSNSTITELVPKGYNPAPVIAKVDTIFSLIVRPISDLGWLESSARAAGYDYNVDLIYTPVVTLHNPYNVNISFHRMNVTFLNVPVAFNFMLDKSGTGNFVSQSIQPGTFESINIMAGNGSDTYAVNIANWANTEKLSSSSAIAAPIVMKPGQTLVCGPRFRPNRGWADDQGGDTDSFDWGNHLKLTESIKAQPGVIPGLGFETYGVAPSCYYIPGRRDPAWSTLYLSDTATNPIQPTSRFYVNFQMQQPRWKSDGGQTPPDVEAPPSFVVTADIQASPSSTLVPYAKLQFDYMDDSTLKKIFDDRVYRYPPTEYLTASNAPAAPPRLKFSDQGAYTHPFAIFSAYARTTNGGVYETGKRSKSGADSPQVNLLKDGRLAGAPFLFHNPSRTNFTMNLATQKPSAQAYELNFQPFLSKGDYQDYMDVDATNRVPSLSGNKTTSGIKSGSYLEFPSGPLMTIADFRRSNALTTAYPPHFVQPVANSRLHPLMSPDKVSETNTGIATDALLDHSFLANHALYDRFYFSTFATRGSTKPDAVFEQFMNGTAPLALQAFQPYLPVGKTIASAKAGLYTGVLPTQTAYKNAAEYQMIRGPFNVNSTSVQAWKAALASMNKSDVATLWARSSALETKAAGGVPIPAMSLLNGGANRTAAVDATKIDNEKSNNWNGYRVLTESELENLATKIVAEVRDRGPFLSMSEFVNRQVGPLGPRTLAGALESAIAESEINEKKNATSADSFLSQVPITATDVSDPKLYNYKTPEATTGNPAAGAPGWVSQGDLLRILEPAATVRGDTFVIRTYGEARDVAGNIIARAYAEAVVQRVPEYVDPADRPSLNPYTDPTASAANKTFGRRINVVSFRWLSTNEI
jgi:hypothetical protein